MNIKVKIKMKITTVQNLLTKLPTILQFLRTDKRTAIVAYININPRIQI